MMLMIIFVSLLRFDSFAVGNYQKEKVKMSDPPCFFNPLCVCSKAFPDLGRVTCKDIPMLNIPQQISRSKVFALHLENNGLRFIEPRFFKQTGVFRIEISHNFLAEISEETFAGLEKSLWELNLQHNRFKKVPNQSFRYLQKLKLLDLSDNLITSISSEDWLGLKDSLKTLILRNNKLSTLSPRTFSILQQLETLDLSGNVLYELDTFAFKDGPMLLHELHLADNLLTSIPFSELSELRELRHLDLSFNLITEIQDIRFEHNKKEPISLFLHTLKLEYNQIQHLPMESFKNFPSLNKTSLNGNPISYIETGAFLRCKIKELYLKNCDISILSDDTFDGLEDHLEVLDLEGNNLTNVPLNFFKDFDTLKFLNLKNNFFNEFDFDSMFGNFQPFLHTLDVSGQQNFFKSFKNLEKLRSVRSLSISKLSQPSLSQNDIPEFLLELEELKISYSNIKTIKSHAFKNIRGIKRLDLSENSFATIESDAFDEVGHSLVYLSLGRGLASSLTQLQPEIFDDLTSLKFLDLSNNRLKVLPSKLFHSMKQLNIIRIQDNFIEFIPKGTFQSDVHSELNTIQFSFNQISTVEGDTFVGLNKLEYLWLNDNRIIKVEKGAFANLNRLKYLYLRGNKINLLSEESFQDLPELEKLDLAYNKLKTFDYNCLEQVGTLSSFSLNLSYNTIDQLVSNLSVTDYPNFAVMHVNIKALDLSHNNISFISPRFFKPIESSITHLYLSYNKLKNITTGVFGNLYHLQWLDVSNNNLKSLEFDSFSNTRNIQVLYLNNNQLPEIPKNLFKSFRYLRILDLSDNDLRILPDNLFSDAIIQKLDLSNNKLTRIPINCFNMESGSALSELDLSDNLIVALPSPDKFAVLRNLYTLDLSKNRIIRAEDGIFSYLGRLHVLDLSHNFELILDSKGQTFYGLDDTLEELILKNLSLNTIPSLRLNSLKYLDLSDNNISVIPFELSHNLSGIERIEMAGNKMVVTSPAINALTKLQYLGMSRNPLNSVNFQQSFTLREIDLRNVSLDTLEKGALGKLILLENLKLSINGNIEDLNLPHLLKDNYGLNHLFIEVVETEGSSLGNEMSGSFSPKLRNLTLFGRGLKTIPRNLLRGIKSPELYFTLHNTSVQDIMEYEFDSVTEIENLTLDVKSNKLKTMGNPNTGDTPNTSKKMFLLDLQISDNNWICDCSIGWIEGWERKKRQYLCEDNSEDCFLTSDDLRSAVCSNRKPETVLEVFKQDLECDWNSSTNLKPTFSLKFSVIIVLMWFLIV